MDILRAPAFHGPTVMQKLTRRDAIPDAHRPPARPDGARGYAARGRVTVAGALRVLAATLLATAAASCGNECLDQEDVELWVWVNAPYTLGTLAFTGACGPEMTVSYAPRGATQANATQAMYVIDVSNVPEGVCIVTIAMPDGTALTKSVQVRYDRSCDIVAPDSELEFP